MRIAIVDDDKVFVEKLQRELENFFHQKEEPVQIFSFNGLGLLDHMEKQNNYNTCLMSKCPRWMELNWQRISILWMRVRE